MMILSKWSGDFIFNSNHRKVPKSVCVCVGGGGAHKHVIYVPSVKNQYKPVYLDIWLFNNSHLCQFIEIVDKIINWYTPNTPVSNSPPPPLPMPVAI